MTLDLARARAGGQAVTCHAAEVCHPDADRVECIPHMAEHRFNSFAEFWPFYLSEHSQPGTRLLHAVGSIVGLLLLFALIVMDRWWLFPLAFVPGYALAWTAHFFIEKNRPATFTHPLWSFMGDWKMLGVMLSGRINDEVRRVRSDY